jgi:hypothetical protein
MSTSKTSGLQTFEAHFEAVENNLHSIVGEITEDRRKWLRLKVANSLLFGAGASFFFYSLAPTRNESSLNEAITLRNAAIPFYEEDEERMKADAEGTCRHYSPKPPVAVERSKKAADARPQALKDREKEIAKRAKQKFDTRTRIAPDLRGFLDGAKYDKIDLMPSEMAASRAVINASKAMSSMAERCEQDILYCCEKWEDAELSGDEERKGYWFSEIAFAEMDAKLVADRVKQYGYNQS